MIFADHHEPPAAEPTARWRPEDAVLRARTMGAEVLLRIPGAGASAPACEVGQHALDVVRAVDTSCGREVSGSPLGLANAAPDSSHTLPPLCRSALELAHRGYQATGGLFDPRLVPGTAPALVAWQPEFHPGSDVRIGRHPVELLGIGRALALRLAAEVLRDGGLRDFSLECSGDWICGGEPRAGEWLAGVPDPGGSDTPIVVLGLDHQACATSSAGPHSGSAGSQRRPLPAEPGAATKAGGSLAAVTVVHEDPVWAHVWSTALLQAGPASVGLLAERRSLAALWVFPDCSWQASSAMRRCVCWPRPADEAEQWPIEDQLELRRLERELERELRRAHPEKTSIASAAAIGGPAVDLPA